jgi:hypothetical protein
MSGSSSITAPIFRVQRARDVAEFAFEVQSRFYFLAYQYFRI